MPYRNDATALQRYMYATLTRHEIVRWNPSVTMGLGLDDEESEDVEDDHANLAGAPGPA